MSPAGHHDLSAPVSKFVTPVETALVANLSVGEALSRLQGKNIRQKIVYFYAVDEQGRLLGIVSTRRLLISPPQTLVADITESPAVSLRENDTLEIAMELFAMHRLLALPVVNDQGQLLGAIDVQFYAEETIDLAQEATDLAQQQRANDLFQLIGMSLEHYRKGSAWSGFAFRMPWLACNIASGLACAALVFVFHVVLAKVLLVAMFIPLVLTLGEAISMQSMTLTLQYLHSGAGFRDRVRLRGVSELGTALLLGLASGLAVALTASFLARRGQEAAALVVGASVLISMLVSGLMGVAIPALLHVLRLDPKLAAGPVTLMLADVFTTGIYLAGATLLLV
jgi:magnesium transporter